MRSTSLGIVVARVVRRVEETARLLEQRVLRLGDGLRRRPQAVRKISRVSNVSSESCKF